MEIRYRHGEIGDKRVRKGFAWYPKLFKVRGETIIIWWKHFEVTQMMTSYGGSKFWIDIDLKLK